MQSTRQSTLKKTLSFYENNYNFEDRCKVLTENSFISAAFKNEIQIISHISKYLQREVTLFVTRCTVSEIRKLTAADKKLKEIWNVSKSCQIHECGHTKPLSSNQCISTVIEKNNSLRYIIATQAEVLQKQIQQNYGIPLLRFKGRILVLDPPSKVDENLRIILKENEPKVIKKAQHPALNVRKKSLENKVNRRPKKSYYETSYIRDELMRQIMRDRSNE